MFFLLRLDDGPHQLPLPIADRSAEALEAALLSADTSERETLLTDLLESDPAFALWACDQCGDETVTQPATAKVAASRLAANLAEWLAVGLVDEQSLGVTVNAQDAVEFAAGLAKVAERATTTADAAASATGRLHARSNARVRHRVYWAVLQCGRPELLGQMPSQRAASPHDERLLPTFRAAPGKSQDSLRSPAPHSDRCDYFLQECPGIASRLPALIARLAPLERLAANYHTQLEAEKLASLKELAYGAGHEINNPLANIAARAQTLLRDEQDPDRQKKLAAIHRQAMRAHEMIADLMLFARPPELVRQPCELGAVVRRAVDELRPQAQQQETTISVRQEGCPIELTADASQLTLAIKAVVVNALEAVTGGGKVDVEISLRLGRHRQAMVVVRDDGPGISPRAARHLFDPFFSGREAGRGLGFGLSKCWRIVTEHGGTVIARNLRRHGAAVTIQLPFSEVEGVGMEPASTPAAA